MSNLERDALLSEARTILSKQNFTKEDSSRAEGILNLADRLGEGAQRLRRAKTAAAELEIGVRNDDNSAAGEVEAEFRQFLRHGPSVLSEKTKKEMAGGTAQTRAEGVGSGVAGGFISPASFFAELMMSLRQHDQLFGIETVIQTRTGSPMTAPILDDTSVYASVVPENGLSNEIDVSIPAGASFGACPMFRTNAVLASYELVNDTFFDLSTALARIFGARFARGIGRAFTATLLAGATSAFTSVSASMLMADEVVDLFSSLDPAYSVAGSWLMNPRTFGAISKIQSETAGGVFMFPAQVDAQGRPLLLGKVVYLSPSMPDLASGQKAVAVGDLSRFFRREVESSLVIKQYSQKYATSGMVAWEGFWRVDGLLLVPPPSGSPATVISPVVTITMHG
jgi:HK97 family phage major capsid protein